jgi:hypothetical protein
MSKEFEKFYDSQLGRYRMKNKGKTEIDYLNFEIERAELYVQENIDIDRIKKKIVNKSRETMGFSKNEYTDKELLSGISVQCEINAFLRNIGKFKRSIEFHTKKLQLEKILTGFNEKEERLKNNPHPTIFVDSLSFNIFSEFLEFGLVNPYKDLSFLFQKLMEEQRLHSIKHLEFAGWLSKQNFITEKIYEIIINKRGFDTKSQSDERLNKYNNIIEKLNDFKG